MTPETGHLGIKFVTQIISNVHIPEAEKVGSDLVKYWKNDRLDSEAYRRDKNLPENTSYFDMLIHFSGNLHAAYMAALEKR